MSNLLKAIDVFADNYIFDLVDYYKNNIRIQQAGDSLEYYIKDLFCNSLKESKNKKQIKYSNIFSYLGNANNPPDIIIQNGDAIEVKKIETLNPTTIALNSSFPKDKLYNNDPLITEACRNCEEWIKKDIIYSIGSVRENKLKSLWFIYGDCFCADKKTYEKIKDCISTGIKQINGVEFSETKELGRVNKVDPLGITYLRIRGMWGISHPSKIFNYISEDLQKNILNVILLKSKYDSFPQKNKNKISKNSKIIIQNIKIKNPNNPAKLIDAKHIFIKGEDK